MTTFTITFNPFYFDIILIYIIWLVAPIALGWDKHLSDPKKAKESHWQFLTMVIGFALIVTLFVLRILDGIFAQLAISLDKVLTKYGKYVFPTKK